MIVSSMPEVQRRCGPRRDTTSNSCRQRTAEEHSGLGPQNIFERLGDRSYVSDGIKERTDYELGRVIEPGEFNLPEGVSLLNK